MSGYLTLSLWAAGVEMANCVGVTSLKELPGPWGNSLGDCQAYRSGKLFRAEEATEIGLYSKVNIYIKERSWHQACPDIKSLETSNW